MCQLNEFWLSGRIEIRKDFAVNSRRHLRFSGGPGVSTFVSALSRQILNFEKIEKTYQGHLDKRRNSLYYYYRLLVRSQKFFG